MIVLDTDHLSILQRPESSQHRVLVLAMERSRDRDFATTAISLEEQMRGWLAAIRRKREVRQQILYYARLVDLVEFYSRWRVVPFDEAAADRFASLRKMGVRIGTMDLKIAAIAMAHDALLLSANVRDFDKAPSLRLENWLALE